MRTARWSGAALFSIAMTGRTGGWAGPCDEVVDGVLYIADTGNHVIRAMRLE